MLLLADIRETGYLRSSLLIEPFNRMSSVVSDSPLISIALCTYNGERYLRKQLDSLQQQDYPQMEIIASDDASIDATPQILEEYAARDQRLKIYRNPSNIGFRRNFERALGLCGGDLIAPSDQDDIWEPSKLSKLQDALGTAMMSYCDSELIDQHGSALGQNISDKFNVASIGDPLAFVFSNCVSGHAMLFRRELLTSALPLPDGLFHDWWLAYVAASQGRIEYCPERLVSYRQHEAAVTDLSGRRSKSASGKSRGHRLDAIHEIQQRIKCFADLQQGREAELLNTLEKLWHEQEHKWICFKLTRYLLRYRHRLFALQSDQRFRHCRRAIKYFWGIPIKRLIQPARYG